MQGIREDLVCLVAVWTHSILALFYFFQHFLVESEVIVFTFYQWLHHKPEAPTMNAMQLRSKSQHTVVSCTRNHGK